MVGRHARRKRLTFLVGGENGNVDVPVKLGVRDSVYLGHVCIIPDLLGRIGTFRVIHHNS